MLLLRQWINRLRKLRTTYDVATCETQAIPVVRLPDTEAIPRIANKIDIPLPRTIYVDEEKRLCYYVVHSSPHTEDLIYFAVRDFCQAIGHYPQEIVLCPTRFIAYNQQYYRPQQGLPIPCRCEYSAALRYDVLVRSTYV